jgi:hypothetical protein
MKIIKRISLINKLEAIKKRKNSLTYVAIEKKIETIENQKLT